MPAADEDKAEDQVEFEDTVAALLTVDPEGIIGRKASRPGRSGSPRRTSRRSRACPAVST
jgi:hypothetical protein